MNKNEFEIIAKQLMQYLEENHHPHTIVIAESGNVQLFEGLLSINADKEDPPNELMSGVSDALDKLSIKKVT